LDGTDLYKLYINPLLDRLETSGLGLKIGNISVSNTACADDIALISEIPDEAQTLVNMATDFAFMEGYQLQPTKSVVINVSAHAVLLTLMLPIFKPNPDVSSLSKSGLI
jgi:hypothetical protein